MLKALSVVQSYSLKKYLDIFLRSIVSYSIEQELEGQKRNTFNVYFSVYFLLNL